MYLHEITGAEIHSHSRAQRLIEATVHVVQDNLPHVSLIASLIPLLLFPSLITRLRIVYFISVLHLVLED